MNSRLISLLTFFLVQSSFAQTAYIQVGEAKTKKSVLALTTAKVMSPTLSGNLAQVQKTIQNDLEFVDFFQLLPASAFAQTQIGALTEVKFPEWSKTGSDYLSYGVFKSENDEMVYEFHLVRIGDNKELLAKRYVSDPDELKILAHTIANDIVFTITGKKGIFLTKIAMVCDKNEKKEIFTMNFDGSDVRQITHLRSISMAPTWSPDGKKLTFSTYNRHSDNNKNIDMIEYSFSTGAIKVISNKKGINSGAAYSPDGTEIAYTMSYTGNPELHILNRATSETTQLTRSVGFDVDPSFSPDGKQIAFVSSRTGKPMVYLMDRNKPEEAKRLTYAGTYNATPRFAPDGKKIVFAGWLEKHFDLFTITADGSKIERLSKDEGNNEDPFYSPDGSFIVFSSNRSAGKNIFLLNVETGNVKRLTFGMGGCVAPQWSPFLN